MTVAAAAHVRFSHIFRPEVRRVMQPMKDDHIRRLLDRIRVLRRPCDLDLLLLFIRHPRALLSSDQIAAFLGYDVNRLGESLDVLVTAELLTRTQAPTSAVGMYVFAIGGPQVAGCPRWSNWPLRARDDWRCAPHS